MNQPLVIERTIHFSRVNHRRQKKIHSGEQPPAKPRGISRIPRVARFMALAIRFDDLLAAGEVADYAEIARLSHVCRARITQIMNLRMLAPDIQEELLFLPPIEHGRDPLVLEHLQEIALTPDWRKQRKLWATLREAKC